MWWMVLAGLALAGDPSVVRLQRTALQVRRPDAARMRAIVDLADLGTDEASWALTEVLGRLEPGSPLARVAIAGLVQNADLAELARQAWPAWARPYVASRIDALLPERCADDEVARLPLDPTLVVARCGQALDVEALAAEVARGSSHPAQLHAARLLRAVSATRGDEVVRAVTSELTWPAEAPPALAGVAPVLDVLSLPDAARGAIGVELVTWRVHLTLTGDQHVPPRLAAELAAVLAPEIEAFGEPRHTIDWLHLLGAAGTDPALVLDRLSLRGDFHWELVVDAHRALDGSARDAIPLLAHRSPIVRARAARRLEGDPAAAKEALARAWRLRPGRTAPLRGDVTPPRLERTEGGSERWSRVLVRWVHRTSRQRDDASLRAVLWFLSEPALVAAMNATTRLRAAEACLQVARRDRPRAALLVQAMDAVLRGVPLDEGERPAPETSEVDPKVWKRVATGR